MRRKWWDAVGWVGVEGGVMRWRGVVCGQVWKMMWWMRLGRGTWKDVGRGAWEDAAPVVNDGPLAPRHLEQPSAPGYALGLGQSMVCARAMDRRARCAGKGLESPSKGTLPAELGIPMPSPTFGALGMLGA